MARARWFAWVMGLSVVPCFAAGAATGPSWRPGVVAPATVPAKAPTPAAGPPLMTPARFARPMQVNPSRLDFPALWSGETARATFTITAPAAGVVSATPPNPPFAIVAMQVLSGTRQTARIGAGGRQPAALVTAVSTVSRRTSPPWQVSCAEGEEVQVEVAFAPVFDLFQMAAGEKSATIALNGPSAYGSWNASVPLEGMFNGKRLVPLMMIPDADRAVTVSRTTPTQVVFTIRFVSTGEPFQATVESCETPLFSLRGATFHVSVSAGGTVNLLMWMLVKPPRYFSWAPVAVPLKANFTTPTSKGTISATIGWTVVPDPYTWVGFSGSCNFVTIAGTLTLTSTGLVTFNGHQWSIGTDPESATFQLAFAGAAKPFGPLEVTAQPLPGQDASYAFHLPVGSAAQGPPPEFLAAARGTPTLGCAN